MKFLVGIIVAEYTDWKSATPAAATGLQLRSVSFDQKNNRMYNCRMSLLKEVRQIAMHREHTKGVFGLKNQSILDGVMHHEFIPQI